MKIVYCVSQLAQRGGAERIVITKANAFVRTYKAEVHILIASQGRNPICYPIDDKIHIHNLNVNQYVSKPVIPGVTFFLTVIKLRRVYKQYLQKIGPDVIFVIERGYDDFIIPFICKNIPRVREFHLSREAALIKESTITSVFERAKTHIINKFVYNLFNYYDGIVLLTERDQDYSSYRTKSYVIPNFIPQIPISFSRNTEKRAISVGRLDRNKNFKDQILIWKKVVSKFPDWVLHIYGDGEERDNLAYLINKEGLQNNVVLCGNQPDIDKYYLDSSIFLFTSLADGFAMVLIEAMAYGLPCLAYDAPCGPSDIIVDGKNGFLIPVGDIERFSKHVCKIIGDMSLRLELGANARKSAENYTEKNIMPRWISLIDQLRV